MFQQTNQKAILKVDDEVQVHRLNFTLHLMSHVLPKEKNPNLRVFM